MVKVDILLNFFISVIASVIASVITFITSIPPQSIITIIIITVTSLVLLPSIIAYWSYEDFSKISRVITFISYLSNFSKDVKRKFSDYKTNLVFILRVVFIPFFLSLCLYVIIKLFRDNFTNFTIDTIEIFYPSVKTLELPEKEKIVVIVWFVFLVLLFFIWLMYYVLELLFRNLKVKVRESIQNKLLKNTVEKNKFKVKELIEGTLVFLTIISFLITAEYSRVINELLYYYIFIVPPLVLLFVLSFYKSHNLVEEFVYNLNKDIVEQKIRLPKICIIAENLRFEGEIVNLDLDRIEIIEKQGEKFKRCSIPWNKISDIFCVEVKKRS